MYDPLKWCQISVACFILHNICMRNNLPMDDENDDGNDGDGNDDNGIIVRQGNAEGMQVRRRLINQRFH